jgi:hypothetical protein
MIRSNLIRSCRSGPSHLERPPMTEPAWQAVQTELARTVAAGGTTRFWLRDDDAIDVTPALDRLGHCTGATAGVAGRTGGGMPVLLAVIPAKATPALADWLAERPLVTPCQHGWSHTNHAGSGERACEIGGTRADDVVLAELARGRDILHALFGPNAADILVPPWNRIRSSVIPQLPAAGYTVLSTFGRPAGAEPAGLRSLNCDLDVIDWRNGRRGRSIPDLCGRLIKLIEAARMDTSPIGILTHHLVHDEAAWRFLDEFFSRMRGLPGVEFVGVGDMASVV